LYSEVDKTDKTLIYICIVCPFVLDRTKIQIGFVLLRSPKPYGGDKALAGGQNKTKVLSTFD
jgi:hypothetical protein